MARALPLFEMMLGAQFDGAMLAQGPLCDSEVTHRIKEVMEESNTVLLVLGHPAMRPNTGFVELLVGLGF